MHNCSIELLSNRAKRSWTADRLYDLLHADDTIIIGTESCDVEEFAANIYSEKVSQPWLTGAEIDHGLEDFEEGDCKAMHDWQVQSFPNCNNIHESDFLSYTHVTAGGWRDVWKAEDFNRDPYVVKSLIFKDMDFRFRDAERHRRDANAYSMLHNSKHVMNIYGYCVNTASFDLVTEGTLNDMLMDKKEMSKLKSKHKLRYAWQIAKSLSDFHSFGNLFTVQPQWRILILKQIIFF